MAIRFQNLALEDTDLFGVSLTGTVSRSDKGALKELAQQAMKRGKVSLILDLSGLTSLGGAGAGVLAGFQRRLLDEGGEAVFAGVQPIVRHFLNSKFDNLPHRHFASVGDAVRNFHNADYVEPVVSEPVSPPPRETPDEAASAPEPPAPAAPAEISDDVPESGAMSFHDESSEADSDLDGLLAEFTGKEARKGRRKEYHYASLDEAVQAVGAWHEGRDREEFATALTNLLFSQGLADRVTLMFPAGIQLWTLDEEWSLPLSGSFATQLVEHGRPLSMLDIREEDLNPEELSFLEELNPDVFLPLLVGKQLVGAILLANDDPAREYTVGENFAFELLLEVLGQREDRVPETSPADQEGEGTGRTGPRTGELVEAARSLDTGDGQAVPGLEDVLYRLAMDLPDADDRPHFWRIFQRHVSRRYPIAQLGFMDPASHRPQVMCGLDNQWMALDLGQERLRMFFRTMQRPVRVENLPTCFAAVKEKLQGVDVQWLVPLRHEEDYLGLVLLACELEEGALAPEDRLMQVFGPTARLLHRFDGNQDKADLTRDLVQVLMGQREERCYGSDSVTHELVRNLDILAREMAFPPAQHRDLVYGCLLRDIGLVGSSDELMTSPDAMTPEQLQVYYQHPLRGEALMGDLGLPDTIVEVIAGHHERYNGQGYPEGLIGREIPLAARVVTVVENYVGMIQGVGGDEPLSPEEAASALREDPGGRFDPDIVSVFLKAVLPQDETGADDGTTQDSDPAEAHAVCPDTAEKVVEV